MSCIIYLDLFFLLNFWVNLLVLFLIRKVTRTYRTLRCILAGMLGALGSTGILLLFLYSENRVVYALHSLLIIIMNLLAFGCSNLVWHLFLFILTGCLLAGGELAILSICGEEGNLVTVGVISASAIIVCIALEKQCRIRWKEEHMKAKTVLEFEDKKMFATALMDTGNKLYDPFYHKPVILVNEQILKDMVERCRRIHPERLQYIPYSSVGKTEGMLEGLMLDRVSICWQEKQLHFHQVIAAMTKEKLYQGKEYQVIFHCGLLEES